MNERSAKALTTRVAIKDEDMHAHLVPARENDRCKNDVGYLGRYSNLYLKGKFSSGTEF